LIIENGEMKKSVVKDKSYLFAIRIVNLYKYLVEERKEYVLSKQILRSGTSIGAVLREGEQAESKADFIHKLSISLKEANEVDYWLNILKDTHYIDNVMFTSMSKDCLELVALLTSIIKTTKSNK
jgi:four helix bundle protein